MALHGLGGQRNPLAALYPLERTDIHCIGGWVDVRASRDGCGKSRPHRDSIPGTSSPERVATTTELTRPYERRIKLEMRAEDGLWAVRCLLGVVEE